LRYSIVIGLYPIFSFWLFGLTWIASEEYRQ